MELFRLLGTIAIENSEANHAIDETANKAGKSESKISNAFGKIGSAAVKVGQVVATGLAAGATAIAGLTKSALNAYADYEQLVGGIETLFKSSANTVKQYASQAFQTAGMSANNYMETVTSFSASLLQSLATDTSASVEVSIEALEKQYDAVSEANDKKVALLEESHEREIEAFEALTEQKIRLINQQYEESLKLIDDEKYRKLKAIDEEIDAINAQTQAERDAIEKKEQEEKIASLEEKVNSAETAEAKLEAEKNLIKYLDDLAQKEREKKRKEEIESLKEQKEVIKEEADEKKKSVKKQYEAELEAVKRQNELQLKAIKKAQKEELEALKKANKEKLDATKAFIEQQTKMLQSSSAVKYSAEVYAEAAEVANRAIIDMADNSNKMGTSMESIQNAYQGFAKQNYTMLDNLKLGYGGTKEEMARLIRDASKLTDIQEELGITVDGNSMSFANIVNAIHIVQTEMGITGTTAKEASSTISGSIASMKAAWSNLMVGIADDNQNLDGLIGNFVDSAGIALENIIPRVEKILGGIGDLVTKLVPIIVEKLPGIIDALLPGLISGATSLMVGLVQALPTILLLLIEQVPFIISEIAKALIQTIPVLLESAKEIGLQFMQGIKGGLDAYDGGALTSIWGNMAKTISGAYTKYVKPTINAFIDMVGELFTENQDKLTKLYELVVAISQWFNDVIVQGILVPAIQFITDFVNNNMETIKAHIQAGIDFIAGIIDFFIALFKGDWQGMWDATVSIMTSAVNMVQNWFILMQEFATSIMNSIWSKIVEIWENIKLGISQKIESIVDGLKTRFTEAKKVVSEIFTNMKNAVADIFEAMWSVVIKGKINSILGGIETMVNGVVSGINKLLDGIEEVANVAGSLLGFDPISIQLSTVSLPRLAKGGIVTKPTVAEVGEDGAEAVIPLENNTQWIQKVSQEMQMQGMTADNKEMISLLNVIIELLKTIITDNGTLPETLVDAIAALKFDINNREFARLVKAVN